MADSDKLIENHNPICGPARLSELNLDPGKYGSCSLKSQKNVGCTFYPTCPFGRRWGNVAPFKDTRPHNVGYYIKPLSGPAKTDWMPCFGFCASLYHRMRAGLAEIAEGHKGEVVRIIGKEGDEIPMKIVRSFDPLCNKSLNSRLTVENVKVKIPAFRDPLEADPALAYEMELDKKFPVDMESMAMGGVADEAEAARLMAEVSGPDIPMPEEVTVSKIGSKKIG